MRYRSGSTAHTLAVLASLGSTTLSAAAAAGQPVVNITADPGPSGNALAAGDYVTMLKPDGTTFQSTVSSIATLEVTLADNVPTGGLASGASFWDHGVAADQTDNNYTPPASATTVFSEHPNVGVNEGGLGEPLVILSNNATAQAWLEQVTGIYAPAGYQG